MSSHCAGVCRAQPCACGRASTSHGPLSMSSTPAVTERQDVASRENRRGRNPRECSRKRVRYSPGRSAWREMTAVTAHAERESASSSVQGARKLWLIAQDAPGAFAHFRSGSRCLEPITRSVPRARRLFAAVGLQWHEPCESRTADAARRATQPPHRGVHT
jgi:hypothetical protein